MAIKEMLYSRIPHTYVMNDKQNEYFNKKNRRQNLKLNEVNMKFVIAMT